MLRFLQQNSIYRSILNRFISQASESGLIQLWTSQSFYDLVESGRLKIRDLSTKRMAKALSNQDLYWIWCWCYALGITVSVVVLIVEGVVYRCLSFLYDN